MLKRAKSHAKFILCVHQVSIVRKLTSLALCFSLLCCCSVAGCLSATPNQTTTSNQKSGLQDSQVSLGITSTALGESASIRATISDGNGRPLDGKIVEWFLDGKSLGKSQSRNGATMLNLTSEYIDNLGNRTHQLQVNFYGDAIYKSSTATSFLLITATGIPVAEDLIV